MKDFQKNNINLVTLILEICNDVMQDLTPYLRSDMPTRVAANDTEFEMRRMG